MNPKTPIDPVALRAASDRLKAERKVVTLRELAIALSINPKTLSARLREEPSLAAAAQLGRKPLNLKKGRAAAKRGANQKAIALALGINETTLRRRATSDAALRAILKTAADAAARGVDRFDPDTVRLMRERGATRDEIAATQNVSAKTLDREAARRPALADALWTVKRRPEGDPDFALRAGLRSTRADAELQASDSASDSDIASDSAWRDPGRFDPDVVRELGAADFGPNGDGSAEA